MCEDKYGLNGPEKRVKTAFFAPSGVGEGAEVCWTVSHPSTAAFRLWASVLLCHQGCSISLRRLRDAGLELKFVTNTTKEPLRLLHARLETLGFVVAQSEVFTSLTAARRLVEESGVRPLLMLEESAKEDFAGQYIVSRGFHPLVLQDVNS